MSLSEAQFSKILSSSRLSVVIGKSAPHLTTFTVVLLLLLYGYEIFNFSLSIDEELFSKGSSGSAVAQGRWSVALLGYIFPAVGGIPMLSTILFCVGLGVSSCVLARVLFRKHVAQWGFVGLCVSSPFWLHLAEFSTVSLSIGIGCLSLTFSLLLILAESRFGDLWAVALLAFATGIYQSFYPLFLVLICIRHLSVLLDSAPVGPAAGQKGFRWIKRSGLIAGVGLLVYLVIQRLFLAVYSQQMIYLQKFLGMADLTTSPVDTLTRTLQRCWAVFSGTDPIFLGYGHVLTLLPLLGLVTVVGRLVGRRGTLTLSQRLLGGASLGAALVFGMVPILMTAGSTPARVLICWIPISAFLGGVALTISGRFEKLLCGVLAAALFISIWISVSLFYSDHVARKRDQLLAARIMARVDRILPDPPPVPIPFVVVGGLRANEAATFHRIEVFGTSFFEHDGGNPFRIAAYLRLLGVDTLEPHQLTEVPRLRPAIDGMPVWPAAGSVSMVDGLLVIKLGPTASAAKPTIPGPKLTPREVTASNNGPMREANRALDGDLNSSWGAGGFPPQWIQFDLGEPTTISKVLLLTVQTPSGPTTHQIYGGPSPDSLKLLNTAEGITMEGQWLEVSVAASDIRYLKVLTIKSPSWIAWAEVEVYK